MRLHYAPGACSLGIHIILEETGVDYELALVDLRREQQFTREFRGINPKGKVPALVRDDGSILTEFTAIAFWLGRTFSAAELLPVDTESQTRALELIDFVVASVHMRGFTLARMPGKFVAGPDAQAELRQTGRQSFADGLGFLAGRLDVNNWFLGNYSVVDAAVFYVVNWAIETGVEIPGNLTAFHGRMHARPAVRAALEQEEGV